MISSASRMIGTGSRPVSAIRPANTEMQLGAPSATAAVISLTWRSVNSAVTLTCTPSALRSRITSASDSPRVVVTGTFTYTFAPHSASVRAWRRISSGSSANTSKEIGRSVISASSRWQNSL